MYSSSRKKGGDDQSIQNKIERLCVCVCACVCFHAFPFFFSFFCSFLSLTLGSLTSLIHKEVGETKEGAHRKAMDPGGKRSLFFVVVTVCLGVVHLSLLLPSLLPPTRLFIFIKRSQTHMVGWLERRQRPSFPPSLRTLRVEIRMKEEKGKAVTTHTHPYTYTSTLFRQWCPSWKQYEATSPRTPSPPVP